MLLSVQNLTLSFPSEQGPIHILRDLSFSLAAGERAALVGESGCGKSMTGLSITRLPPTNHALLNGTILFHDQPILAPNPKIAYIFQDPIASLNPVMRIEKQLKEAAKSNRERPPSRNALIELLATVDLPNPEALLRAYPCELSGGMCQRINIAMGLARNPELLIADEPTTALDVTTQADVMDLISRIVEERKMALLMATHNLGLVANRCDTIHVLYAGRIVESGPVREVLANPLHPYTQGLLAAVPKIEQGRRNQLRDIPGAVPTPAEITSLCTTPDGGQSCAFRPRCPHAATACATTLIPHNIGSHQLLCTRPPTRPN